MSKIDEMTHLMVEAGVRYWEDATVSGQDDDDGKLVPFRKGDLWCPVIRLKDGRVENWPQGVTAKIHYKVCDAGEYFLSTDGVTKSWRWTDYYVPNDLLCVGSNGYGDYIIFTVKENGYIENWREKEIDEDRWERVEV